jgi:hypothetical protein
MDAGATITPGNQGTAGSQGMSSGAAGASTPSAGTGGAADTEDGGANSGGAATQDPWFVGYWVVDQPAHALYEATLYELKAGGTLVVHDTMITGAAPYTGYVTGTVSDMQGGVRCALDAWWASEGNHRVAFGSACTDGTQRTIMLAFQEDDPTQAAMPTIESVGNESGWTHRDQLWMWRKCATRANCPPF